jgi:hypothetical protein
MQCACAMLSSVACPALQIVFTLSRKKHDFREIGYCVLIFFTTFSEKVLILRINERDMIKIYFGLHVSYWFFLSDFNEN